MLSELSSSNTELFLSILPVKLHKERKLGEGLDILKAFLKHIVKAVLQI